MITVTVNNKEEKLVTDTVVETLLASLQIATNGIAVAINNTVIPKSDWTITKLHNDDTVTIIQATQGG